MDKFVISDIGRLLDVKTPEAFVRTGILPENVGSDDPELEGVEADPDDTEDPWLLNRVLPLILLYH